MLLDTCGTPVLEENFTMFVTTVKCTHGHYTTTCESDHILGSQVSILLLWVPVSNAPVTNLPNSDDSLLTDG